MEIDHAWHAPGHPKRAVNQIKPSYPLCETKGGMPRSQTARSQPAEDVPWKVRLRRCNIFFRSAATRCRPAGRWLPRPRHAVDLVRLTVGVCWATICWRGRGCHPAARVARGFLSVELVGYVVASASAPASRCAMTTRLYLVDHLRARQIVRRRRR